MNSKDKARDDDPIGDQTAESQKHEEQFVRFGGFDELSENDVGEETSAHGRENCSRGDVSWVIVAESFEHLVDCCDDGSEGAIVETHDSH